MPGSSNRLNLDVHYNEDGRHIIVATSNNALEDNFPLALSPIQGGKNTVNIPLLMILYLLFSGQNIANNIEMHEKPSQVAIADYHDKFKPSIVDMLTMNQQAQDSQVQSMQGHSKKQHQSLKSIAGLTGVT